MHRLAMDEWHCMSFLNGKARVRLDSINLPKTVQSPKLNDYEKRNAPQARKLEPNELYCWFVYKLLELLDYRKWWLESEEVDKSSQSPPLSSSLHVRNSRVTSLYEDR